MRGVLWLLTGLIGCALGVAEADTVTPAPALDRLIQQFNAGAPEQDGVEIDAWTETGPEGRAIVVVVAPRGATRLVADPGITVTPTARPGVAWGTALPYRKVEPAGRLLHAARHAAPAVHQQRPRAGRAAGRVRLVRRRLPVLPRRGDA